MKQLIYKEFRLAVHPTNYLFLLFGAMLLIPNYPYQVGFFYVTLALFFYFLSGRESNDAVFTALLPVRKSDAVRARCIVCTVFEVLSMIVAVPFAVLNHVLNIPSTLLDCNVAFFGLSFVLFAIFNAMFIPSFYKTGWKIRFLWPAIVIFLFISVCAALVFFPVVGPYLDDSTAAGMIKQLPVLFGGIVIYVVGMLLTCRRAIRNYEHVDL